MGWRVVLLILLYIQLKTPQVEAGCDTFNYPATTEITASGSIEYISSTNYPDSYPNDARCAWHVTASDVASRVIIHVRDFSTQGTEVPCSRDYATIYNGASDAGTEIFRVCPGTANERKVYISDTNEIFVTFYANGHLQYSGFQIAVFTNDTSNQPPCGTNVTVTSAPQFLLSDNLATPYTASFECAHELQIEDDSFDNGIRLHFYFMDIETSADCTVASVAIGTYASGSALEAYKLCQASDSFTETTYNVKGSISYVNFTTSASINTTADYFGYFIEYQTTFVGLSLTQPNYNDTVNLTVSELQQLGSIDTTNGVIVANATGTITISVQENGVDSTIFGIDDTQAPTHYITLISLLDFETTPFYALTIYISSSDAPAPEDTATVYFNITVADLDDVAPVIHNLPADIELLRSRTQGYLLYTVNATDADGTSPNFTTVIFAFASKDPGFLTLNDTTGELTLSVDADTIAISVTNVVLDIGAYSVSISSGLSIVGSLNITIPPDSPPSCTSTLVYTSTLEIPKSSALQTVPYETEWNCTDEYNVTYSLGTVVPTLTSTLFSVASDTGLISIVRAFAVTEVPGRVFSLEIIATDSINQTTNFTAQANVTNVVCLPNPRHMYARMDASVGDIILYDFNCTSTVGMTYSIASQFPANTFSVASAQDGPAYIILNAPVYKIKFYSLSVFMTNGVDEQTMTFNVVVQFEKCGLTASVATRISPTDPLLSGVCFICVLYFLLLT